MSLIFPAIGLILFITSSRYKNSTKFLIGSFIAVLAWSALLLQKSDLNPGYYQVAMGALYIVVAFLMMGTLSRKGEYSDIHGQKVSFMCPFCNVQISFPVVEEGSSKKCPECSEVVTVTEDPEVHKAAKESYASILEAMESEELQENPENIKDPFLGNSVFGTQFELSDKKSKKDT